MWILILLSYNFISNNDNSYSVYFLITEEDNIKLSNGEFLKEYTELNNIPTIFFSLSERGFGKNFDLLTNKMEFLEVMGEVVFLILEYIKKHNYTTFSIGEVGDKKIHFYNHYRKYFKDFDILTGKSKNYIDDDNNKISAYYLVKNNNITSSNEKLKLDDNLYFIL